ncbi:MAG: uroporphyrinogen decarboxylase family protein [Planctomycetota bacterium]
MRCRQKVKKALNHEESDKVPVDFGASPVTGMHISRVAAVRDYYGLEKRLVKAFEPSQMLGWLDDDLRDAIGVDVAGVSARNTMFGFPNENWKQFKTPWGQEILVSEHFKTTMESNGDVLIYPGGDIDAPPSGRMPQSGFFFDAIIRQEQFDEANLNPEDNTEEFNLLSDDDLRYFEKRVKQLASSQRAIIAGIGGTGFGDIALVPAPFLKHPKGIRDITEWYISTVTRQDYIHEVFSRQCEIALENLKRFYGVVGDAIDVIYICGTDFGTQISSFCSPATFDSLYGPYYKKINTWVHENTTWKTFKHCCGSVEPFMSHFIDSGFDIINPVQTSAASMEPKKLKECYGDKLVFWGGGVDTQKTLPFGTTEEVRTEVLQNCEIFSKNGGFVFNSIHNVQANVPVENIVAMINAVKEFNGEKPG